MDRVSNTVLFWVFRLTVSNPVFAEADEFGFDTTKVTVCALAFIWAIEYDEQLNNEECYTM